MTQLKKAKSKPVNPLVENTAEEVLDVIFGTSCRTCRFCYVIARKGMCDWRKGAIPENGRRPDCPFLDYQKGRFTESMKEDEK
jgi:hypothetical protein